MKAHTPGPWRIVIDGTCSGAWPHIFGPDFQGDDVCDGEAIAELGTCFVERRVAGMPGPYSEKPKRFRKTRDHDQVMADAILIAAAPEIAIALEWALDRIRTAGLGEGEKFAAAEAVLVKAVHS